MPNRIIEAMNGLSPATAGFLMAVFIAFLRVVYDQEDTRLMRVMLESVICGALALTINSGVMAMGFGPNWAIFIGGTVGYIGSVKVRSIAMKIISRKMDK